MTTLLPDSFDHLSPITDGIWHVQRRFSIMGIPASSRMTVVRLHDGGLWLHSPVRLDDALRQQIDALGPVRHIVAPNQFHHLFAPAWAKAYPQARCHAAPGLGRKVSALANWEVLNEQDSPWQSDLDQCLLQGMPAVNEFVWLHRASGTLILTDSAQWMPHPLDWRDRLFARLMGVHQSLAVSRLFRNAIKDRQALRASFEQVLTWDFDRVVLGHEVVIDAHGKGLLQQALQRLQG